MEYARTLHDFVESEARKILWNNSFSAADFRNLPDFLRKELLRYLFDWANAGTVGLSQSNLAEMERFVLTANGGTIKEIKKLHLSKRNNIIFIDHII